jgi:hypothetical protein
MAHAVFNVLSRFTIFAFPFRQSVRKVYLRLIRAGRPCIGRREALIVVSDELAVNVKDIA